MDSFMALSPAKSSSGGPVDSFLPALPLIAVAAAVWFLEQRRRAGTESFLPGVSNAVRQLVPELSGLALCGVVAVALLYRRNGHAGSEDNFDGTDHEIWRKINDEWPLLTTADSLLGMQSALRFVLLASMTARNFQRNVSILSRESAAFLLLAGSCRVLLLAVSPKDVYHLDGPLGGNLNVVLEVLSVPLLVRLATGTPRVGLWRTVAMAAFVTLAGRISWCHRFNLAHPGDEHLDMLFSFAQLLDFLAAGAILIRTLGTAGEACGVAADFAYCLLPVQQFLQAFFILTAFAEPFQVEPSLVGAGKPFEVLQTCALAQVAFYTIAAVWHFIVRSEADLKMSAGTQELPLIV